MIDAKIIAVVLGVIVVAGGVTAAVVYNNNNNDSDDEETTPSGPTINPATLSLLSSEISPVLEVYGNVNNDLVIDSADKTLLQEAITNGTTANYKYADANFDGTVDDADVTYIQSIIDATPASPVQVKHLNRFTDGDYYTVSYAPINSFVMSGSANMFLMMKYVGAGSEIKGIAYNGKIDATLYSEYQTLFSDSSKSYNWKTGTGDSLTYRVGGSAGYFNTELVSNHITSDGVKAILTADSAGTYLKGDNSSNKGCLDEKTATDPTTEGGLNLSVYRFKAASTDMTEYLSDLAMLAFVLQKDAADISDMATWCSDFIADMNAKLNAHVGVDTNQFRIGVTSAVSYSKDTDGNVDTYNYISSKTSDYTAVAVAAGGLFAFDTYDGFGTSTSSKKMTDLGVWINAYDVEKLIHIKTASGTESFSWYGGSALTDGKSTLQIGPLAFSMSEAYYNNNVYVVCGDMPVVLRMAYAAHVLYPDVFSEDWALNYNIDHSKKFLDLSEETIRGGVFYVTMSDLGLSGGSA